VRQCTKQFVAIKSLAARNSDCTAAVSNSNHYLCQLFCCRYGTALIAACANCKEYMVDLLLQQDDLDVNQCNSRGETALMHAAKVH
jgi:ankyrin repeat protein